MKNNYYKFGIIITMLIMFILFVIIRNINIQKENYLDTVKGYNNTFKDKEVLNAKVLKQFGYSDMFEAIKVNDRLKIVKFEKFEVPNEKLSVLLEFVGDIEEFRKIIDILKNKDNFEKISKMIIKSDVENVIIIEVELKFGVLK